MSASIKYDNAGKSYGMGKFTKKSSMLAFITIRTSELRGPTIKCIITLLNYLTGDTYSKSKSKGSGSDIVFRWKKGIDENVMTLRFWH